MPLDDLRAYHHARARQHLVGMQSRTHVTGDAAVADIVKPRNARPHILSEVFAVFIATCDLHARIERVVHARDIVLVHGIVRVKVDKRVVIVVFGDDLAEAVLQSVTHALMLGIVVVVFENDGTRFPRALRRVVRAVVRDHEHVEQFPRIILFKERPYGIADDFLFVSGGDDDAETVLFFRFGVFSGFDPEKQHVYDLNGKGDSAQYQKYVIDNVDYRVENVHVSFFSLFSCHCMDFRTIILYKSYKVNRGNLKSGAFQAPLCVLYFQIFRQFVQSHAERLAQAQ